jgi:large subunit ribosomal protein L18
MDTQKRYRRHARIRARVTGSGARPRASVFRSARMVSVQLVDDMTGQTLVAVHGQVKKGQTKTAQAEAVGKALAKQAKAKGISQIVFDRGGYRYHGRVKALADAMRSGGLVF